MKVSQAVDFHLPYHRANSKKKIPSKPVSSSSPVSLPDSANVISQAFLRRRYWVKRGKGLISSCGRMISGGMQPRMPKGLVIP